MMKEDMIREKQKADEELANILRGLVVEPVEQFIDARLSEDIFNLELKIDGKLKEKTAPLSKARTVDQSFVKISDAIDKLEKGLIDVGGDIEGVDEKVLKAVSSMDFLVGEFEVIAKAVNKGLDADTEIIRALRCIEVRINKNLSDLEASIAAHFVDNFDLYQKSLSKDNQELIFNLGEMLRQYEGRITTYIAGIIDNIENNNRIYSEKLQSVENEILRANAQVSSQNKEIARMLAVNRKLIMSLMVILALVLVVITGSLLVVNN